jgi:hypothetical protein
MDTFAMRALIAGLDGAPKHTEKNKFKKEKTFDSQ